jgi:hypothetical protein
MIRTSFEHENVRLPALQQAAHNLVTGDYESALLKVSHPFKNDYIDGRETVVTFAFKHLNEQCKLVEWGQNKDDFIAQVQQDGAEQPLYPHEVVGSLLVIKAMMQNCFHWNKGNVMGETPLALLDKNPMREIMQQELFGLKPDPKPPRPSTPKA